MLKDLLRLTENARPKSGNGPAYTGKAADVRGILNLAARYRDAANMLGEGLSKPNHFPRRLLALHSIELYLDALLLANGLDGETIRGFGSETTATLSQMNRVMATLDEVSLKVRKMLRGCTVAEDRTASARSL
nr:hypothetical protein [Rhizobium sp. P28RR-XV]